MKKIIIECPDCGMKMSFNEVNGYQNMMVRCPKCGKHDKAGMFRNITPAQQQYAHNPQQNFNHGHTVIRPKGAMDPGQLRVIATNQVLRLSPGMNTIGRRAMTSTASIQIDTQDMYMSRSHVRIDVKQMGNTFAHHLVEIKATNKVRYNGMPLGAGDILPLKYGDRLILGNTELIFESQYGAEKTMMH